MEQLNLQSLLGRVTGKSSGLSMGPRGCPGALGAPCGFFSAALARARECDLPPTEIASLDPPGLHGAPSSSVARIFPEWHFRGGNKEEGSKEKARGLLWQLGSVACSCPRL